MRRWRRFGIIAVAFGTLISAMCWTALLGLPEVDRPGIAPVPAQIVARTALIMDGEGQGTVTLVRRGGVVWGLTCAHCTDGLALRVRLFDPDTVLDAELVLKDDVADIAIVRVPKVARDLPELVLYAGEHPASLTPLYHVGNFHGSRMPLSFSVGVFSGSYRNLDGVLFDQTTVTALPGSSGGGVYLQSGEYIGMISRAAASDVNFIVPARTIRRWAIDHNADFIFEPTLRVPNLPTSQPADDPHALTVGQMLPHSTPGINLPFWR